MFYQRCVKAAIDARKLGYKTKYNPYIKELIDPIDAMQDYANCCLTDTGNWVQPLFPVGQIAFPDWVHVDIEY